MECERCQGGGQIVKYLGCDDGCYEFEPCPDCDGKGETMSNYTCECPAVFGGDDAQRDRDIHMGSCGFVKIRKERDLLLLQIELMKNVVDAAVAWTGPNVGGELVGMALSDAVEDYQKSLKPKSLKPSKEPQKCPRCDTMYVAHSGMCEECYEAMVKGQPEKRECEKCHREITGEGFHLCKECNDAEGIR